MGVGDEKPSKRTANPGVRVIGGRIYDSSNGKTCHQCRQKTMDFVAPCKAMNENKPCKIMYCHKCLSNRYGEKAEEVVTSDDWLCPKCRGICNCSFCRKRRGQNPTGILTHKARASGLSSVSELLEVEGSDNFAYQKKPKPQEDKGRCGYSNGDVELVDVDKDKNKNKVVGKIKKAKADNKHVDKDKNKNKVVGKIKKAKADSKHVDKDENKNKVVGKIKKAKADSKLKEEIEFEAQLPQGISMNNVSGIGGIPTEEIGNVLQFLEFCSAFRKVLDLKEGQADSVVAELFSSGRSIKRKQYSYVIQMMIQLLNLISDDRDEMSLSLSATDTTWFSYVGEFLSQSGVLSDCFPPEAFKSGASKYEKMDGSKRLKLLIFLCDESLSTREMRNFMEEQYTETETKKKEAKQKAAAAKEKEKQLRQKMQSDLAKTHLAKNGAPLSVEEHHAMLSRIKAEAKEAHGEMLEAMGMGSTRQRCDAVRTDPILANDDGSVLWKLNCFEEEEKFLLQELGRFEDLPPLEKWLEFKPEQKQEIEKCISAKRMKLMRAQKNANVEYN